MRWSYDFSADALFIFLRDGGSASHVDMPDGVTVDLDAHGAVVAIEVLSAASPWDIEPVIQRFGLDDATAKSLRTFRQSPLTNFRRHVRSAPVASPVEPLGSSAANRSQLIKAS